MKQHLTGKGVPYRMNQVPNSTRWQIFLRDPNNVEIELNFETKNETAARVSGVLVAPDFECSSAWAAAKGSKRMRRTLLPSLVAPSILELLINAARGRQRPSLLDCDLAARRPAIRMRNPKTRSRITFVED